MDAPLGEILTALGIPASYGRDPRLPRYAEAAELVDVEPNIVGYMQRLTAETARAWREMKSAAAADEVTLLLVSGFRSIARQAELIRKKLEQGQSVTAILRANAAPGFSQHHTGQAVDVATLGCPPLTEAFETTPAFAWLETNAGRFSFTMPYPRRNGHGIGFEPWHWSRLGDRV